jgi:uncharacterized protein (TIGR03086 family)
VSTAEVYRRAIEQFGQRVQEIGDDQWTNPTPCTEWDVRALVNHVVSEDMWVVPLLEGQTIEQVGTRLDGDLLGDDPKGAWKQTHADASNAVGAEGVTERTVSLSRGPTPAGDYLREVAADNVIHTWDLAMGTGGDSKLDPELVTFAYEFFEPQLELWRSFGALGPEVPIPMDADRQTKLLGIVGRKA